jgi:hypothetical protein
VVLNKYEVTTETEEKISDKTETEEKSVSEPFYTGETKKIIVKKPKIVIMDDKK